jgi:4-hydroxybenzoate polyprenyltransferase
MPPFWKKIANLLHLGRVGMLPLTTSVPILGALTLCRRLAFGDIMSLGTIGTCAHLFGFVLNDIIDHPIDRSTPYHNKHPLVTGHISFREAWVFSLVQVPVAFGIYWVFLNRSFLASLCMLSSIVLSIVYNAWSKRGHLPHFFPELALSLSVGSLGLFGSATQAGNLPPKSIAFASTLTLILLLLNSIPSGLKDLRTDQDFGAKSFCIAAGCKIIDNDYMLIPLRIWIYASVVQGLIILCFVVLMKLFDLSLFAIVLVGVLVVCSTLHLRMVLASSSFLALRKSFPILNGFYNYLALCAIVIVWMPISIQIIYGFLMARVLFIPLHLSYRMWRNHYYLLIQK